MGEREDTALSPIHELFFSVLLFSITHARTQALQVLACRALSEWASSPIDSTCNKALLGQLRNPDLHVHRL
jgi:hypothetical protein